MTRFLLASLLLCATPARSEDAKTPASPEIVKSVEEFVKAPVSDLPPDSIEGFLRVDPETLPKKLQGPYQARRLELYTLKQLVENKKKGMIRMMDKTCDVPQETKADSSGVYKAAGFGEITPDDVACAVDRTHCSEQELMCEFTLRETIDVDKKGKKKYHFFLNPNDPLMAIVTACRNNSGGQTNFFGAMTPTCTH